MWYDDIPSAVITRSKRSFYRVRIQAPFSLSALLILRFLHSCILFHCSSSFAKYQEPNANIRFILYLSLTTNVVFFVVVFSLSFIHSNRNSSDGVVFWQQFYMCIYIFAHESYENWSSRLYKSQFHCWFLSSCCLVAWHYHWNAYF